MINKFCDKVSHLYNIDIIYGKNIHYVVLNHIFFDFNCLRVFRFFSVYSYNNGNSNKKFNIITV